MAIESLAYSDNVFGHYYVDADCIACDTCHTIAPTHFQLTDDSDHAIVICQPTKDRHFKECEDAMESCPVNAIGTRAQ